MNKALLFLIDLLVPLGRFLRTNPKIMAFERWPRVVFSAIPQTFFVFWLTSFIPFVGTLFYSLVLIPLSIYASRPKNLASTALLYYTVILIGFGGIWSFIGHTFMAEMVAESIGWSTSPFQTELAFYTLGSAVAGILAIWLRGHMITAIVITKSVFWYGAAYVHIRDFLVHNNTAPSNIGPVLIGDIVFPTLLLVLLYLSLKGELGKSSSKLFVD